MSNKETPQVVRIFGPTVNKLIGLTIFFYVCLIAINAIVFFIGQKYAYAEWWDAHKPERLTDILSDAGTLSLGAALGVMKGKFDDDERDDDYYPKKKAIAGCKPDDDFDDYEGYV